MGSLPCPHFVILSFMSQGHTIPILHLSRLLRRRSDTITIVTTAENSKSIRDYLLDIDVSIIELPFPQNIPGVPQGPRCIREMRPLLGDNFDISQSMLEISPLILHWLWGPVQCYVIMTRTSLSSFVLLKGVVSSALGILMVLLNMGSVRSLQSEVDSHVSSGWTYALEICSLAVDRLSHTMELLFWIVIDQLLFGKQWESSQPPLIIISMSSALPFELQAVMKVLPRKSSAGSLQIKIGPAPSHDGAPLLDHHRSTLFLEIIGEARAHPPLSPQPPLIIVFLSSTLVIWTTGSDQELSTSIDHRLSELGSGHLDHGLQSRSFLTWALRGHLRMKMDDHSSLVLSPLPNLLGL
ncbi:hypothetical protein BUALT_Bualt07G0036000 [Buddleja alternifolia]|uniref:Uncharacterized protein n=1 Tax=Buddleja alternifolia TaxID=168488 RepID=A0AAV6XFX0_9LAMI|nr:hypothetical protein BUALT_Bualt07G0036000 [Buddleja alternifolia]